MSELNGFDKLIAALNIFKKYSDTQWPTHCEHDILYVCVDPSLVSDEDKAALEQLSFTSDTDTGENFCSYEFGSA